jgi:hypothetical protein
MDDLIYPDNYVDPYQEARTKEAQEMQEKYRAVFGSGLGLDVLVDMMSMLHYGSTLDPDNPLQIAEHNLAVTILASCGVHATDNFRNLVGTMLGLRSNQASHDTK